MSNTPAEPEVKEVEFDPDDLFEGAPDNLDRGDPDNQDDEGDE